MERRQFIQWLATLPVAASGCAVIPDAYDRKTYGTPNRIAIIAAPTMFVAAVSSDMNMFARAGENDAMADRIRAALEPFCADFGPRMRKKIAEGLSRNGIDSNEIAFRQPKGLFNHAFIHSTIDYPNVNERFFLESKISLCVVRAGKDFILGAATYNRLLTPDSKLLWRKAVSVGPSIYDGSSVIDVFPVRYQSVEEVISSAAQVSEALLGSAALIGADVASSLVRATT